MSQIISIHSFRRGTGKSTIVANVATLLALAGHRVGVIDISLPAPSLHILFRLDEDKMGYTLNDFIWGQCDIQTAVYDVTPFAREASSGRIFLVPASVRPQAIQRITSGGYYVNLLVDACHDLLDSLALDIVVIDTYAGLNKEAQLAMAISDALVVVLRPDEQDYEGTGIILEVGRRLEIPHMMLVVNEMPADLDRAATEAAVAEAFSCQVGAALPHSQEMMLLASAELFVLHFAHHPLTAVLQQFMVAIRTLGLSQN